MNKFFIVSIIILNLLVGCINLPTEPNYKNIESSEITYDEGERTSGIIGLSEDGKGFLVTKHFIENRYNNYIKLYGKSIGLDLKPFAGTKKLCDWLYYIDNQHMFYFLNLNKKRMRSQHELQ